MSNIMEAPRVGLAAANRNFVRNSEGSSSVRLRRRKDFALQQQAAAVANGNNGSEFTNIIGGYKKNKNRHSGDFFHYNYGQSNGFLNGNAGGDDIVIPAVLTPTAVNNRYSMFAIPGNNLDHQDHDHPSMETLDRRILNGESLHHQQQQSSADQIIWNVNSSSSGGEKAKDSNQIFGEQTTNKSG